MAPPHTHNHLNLSTEPLHLHRHLHRHRRCSKAQMCFFNIIHIISSFPTPDVTHHNQIPQNKGLVVDLNLQLTAEDSELAVEHSEISHVGDQSSGVDYNEEAKPRDEGYLGLLIEAAQLILGDNSDQDKKPAATARGRGGGAKRKQQCNWTAAAEAEWYAEFEDTSPVVKSKRGRNQVLPFKYRDSVVEPLVRWTPSSKRRSK